MLQGQRSAGDAEGPSWKPCELSYLFLPSAQESQREVDSVTAHFSSCVSRSLLPLIFPDWLQAVNENCSLSWWHGADMHVQMLLWLQVIEPPVYFPCHCEVLIGLFKQSATGFGKKLLLSSAPFDEKKIATYSMEALRYVKFIVCDRVQGVLTPTHCFVWW